jgi:hypothetical protein
VTPVTTVPTPPPPRSLLDDLPLGGLLGRVLWLALGPDTREAFVGDLVEEAQLRLRFCSRGQMARWVWGQTLRSLPALLGMRLRALGSALLVRLVGPGARPLRLAAGTRAGRPGWPLSLAVSLLAHTLVVVAAVGLVLSRVEEVHPPAPDDITAHLPTDIETTRLDDFDAVDDLDDVQPPATAKAPAAVRSASEVPAPRRYRPARKPLLTAMVPLPVAGPLPGRMTPGSGAPGGPATLAVTHEVRSVDGDDAIRPNVWLPPRVAEKRCLSCPQPQLPPHYARFARGRDMLVRTCVSAQGEVQSATVTRGFDSIISREVTETVRGWRLSPYYLSGHPVPFCYVTRFLFVER